MRVARGWVAFVLGMLASARPALAGDETRTMVESQVNVRVWSPWPASAFKGWAPIRIELENGSEEERRLLLVADSRDWQSTRRVERKVALAPGERGEVELLVPLGSTAMNSFGLQVVCEDENEWFPDCVGNSATDMTIRQVLYVREGALEAGETERWSAALSQRAVGEASSPGSPTTPDVDLAHTTFAGLARQWGAYTSLDLVVLDLDQGVPSEAELAPLLAWVRSGGELLVIGERARAEAENLGELAAWMEPRFLTERAQGSEYRCGLGRLCIGKQGAEVLANQVEIVELLSTGRRPTPGWSTWRGAGLSVAIPGLELVPYRTFGAILILFALVIGPVNFFFLARRRRAVLLLVTIPAIAACATLLLVLYGIFVQGLDVKSASVSVVMLDERAHRTSVLEYRQFFAGMAPAPGLRPAAGTVVHARGNGTPFENDFAISYGETTWLTGDYLPTREPTDQVLQCERAERARLGARLEGNTVRVDNNLGAALAELVLRTPDGRTFVRTEPLAPGESAALAPREDDARRLLEALHEGSQSLTPQVLGPTDELLPAGCYLARLAQNPLRDDCGVQFNELVGDHVILGVLPADAEDWR